MSNLGKRSCGWLRYGLDIPLIHKKSYRITSDNSSLFIDHRPFPDRRYHIRNMDNVVEEGGKYSKKMGG